MWRVLGNESLNDAPPVTANVSTKTTSARSSRKRPAPVSALSSGRPSTSPPARRAHRSRLPIRSESAVICGKYCITGIMRQGATGYLYSAVVIEAEQVGQTVPDNKFSGSGGYEVVLKVEDCAAPKRQMQNEWKVYRALEAQRNATQETDKPLPARYIGGFPCVEFDTAPMPPLSTALQSSAPYDMLAGGTLTGAGLGPGARSRDRSARQDDGDDVDKQSNDASVGVAAGRPVNVLAMERLGPNLMSLSQDCRGGHFSLQTMLRLGSQMVSLLCMLHETGYVHRDIKPENFCVGRGRQADKVFLIDYGLACRADPLAQSRPGPNGGPVQWHSVLPGKEESMDESSLLSPRSDRVDFPETLQGPSCRSSGKDSSGDLTTIASQAPGVREDRTLETVPSLPCSNDGEEQREHWASKQSNPEGPLAISSIIGTADNPKRSDSSTTPSGEGGIRQVANKACTSHAASTADTQRGNIEPDMSGMTHDRTVKAIARTSKASPTGLVGSVRYLSVWAHEGKRQTRRCDLESLGYVLLYLIRGKLPWQGLSARTRDAHMEKIRACKEREKPEVLCKGLPALAEYFKYVQGLRPDERADYSRMTQIFEDGLRRRGFSAISAFDWQHRSHHASKTAVGVLGIMGASHNASSATQSRDRSLHSEPEATVGVLVESHSGEKRFKVTNGVANADVREPQTKGSNSAASKHDVVGHRKGVGQGRALGSSSTAFDLYADVPPPPVMSEDALNRLDMSRKSIASGGRPQAEEDPAAPGVSGDAGSRKDRAGSGAHIDVSKALDKLRPHLQRGSSGRKFERACDLLRDLMSAKLDRANEEAFFDVLAIAVKSLVPHSEGAICEAENSAQLRPVQHNAALDPGQDTDVGGRGVRDSNDAKNAIRNLVASASRHSCTFTGRRREVVESWMAVTSGAERSMDQAPRQ